MPIFFQLAGRSRPRWLQQETGLPAL